MPGLIPRMFIMVASFIAVFLPAAPALAQLPPRIMADRYLIKAEQLEAGKDYAGALKAIGKAIALQKKHGFELPVEFHFKYARIAMSADSIRIAYDSVNRYLSVAGPDGEFYKEALALSLEAEGPEILPEETCDGKPVGSSCWMALADRPECYVWNGNLQADETVTWSGGCVHGVVTGEGTETWVYVDADSNRVTQWFTCRNAKGKTDDGPVIVRNSGGDYFEGSYLNGKRHGRWVFRLSDGGTNEGTFENGKRHGQWTHRNSYGGTSEGPYVNGKMQGRWVRRDSEGNTEAGPYENGEKHGQWVVLKISGRRYEKNYVYGKLVSERRIH